MVLKTELENICEINGNYHTEHLLDCKLTRSKCLINISQAGSETYLYLC